MFKFRWVFFMASRALSQKKSRARASSLLSMLEIGTGVLALTVIIAVMNGFQLGFIESILEVSSYYVRVEHFSLKDKSRSERLINDIKKIPGVVSAVPFIEIKGLISGTAEGFYGAALVRGLPHGVTEEDPGFAGRLEMLAGDFEIKNPDSILLGAELALRLSAEPGDTVEFISISDIIPGTDGDSGRPEQNVFTVDGIFRTGYYEYDAGWAFINIDAAAARENKNDAVTLGIKLKNRYRDAEAVRDVSLLLSRYPDENFNVRSWRDFNKSFFNALRTEKLLMFVLVGLIFIVVAMNIYQAQRRTVLERGEEIGLLRAVGATNFGVRWTFALKGLLIGFIGATGGMALAVLISTHIREFFSLIELIIPDFLSKQIFYIKEYTARLIFHEVLFIYLFAVLSAFFAAWFASGRAGKIRPSEVLRYE